jgi:alkanesulfonate monooxygenase SsuD/methylene tetrahydromethanopterin reductase-like flavin-dependent oxidoreductase (luciferase family)
MKLSMSLPTMAGDLDRGRLREWCAAVEAGPFHAIAVGERIGYDNLEMHTALTYAAAVTERVRIASTLTILPMYATAWAAKSLATLDVVSDGRVDVVVGVGGRKHDFDQAERSFANRHQRLDDQVAELRRIWAGGEVDGEPVGPTPVQPGGPPVFASAMGPKSTARAARWADGNMGFSLAPNTDDHAATIATFRDAWAAAGRSERPYLSTSFWYSLGPDADDELRRYAERYLGIFGDDTASIMASMCTAAGIDAVAEAIQRCEAAGMDELYLVPTSADPADLTPLLDALI